MNAIPTMPSAAVSITDSATDPDPVLANDRPRVFMLDPLRPRALFAPAEIGQVPLIAAFDAGLEQASSAAFPDGPILTAAAADASGNLNVIGAFGGKSVFPNVRP